MSDQNLTVTTSAVTTLSPPGWANYAYIRVLTGPQLAYTIDGVTVPSSSAGTQVYTGEGIRLPWAIRSFQCKAVGSSVTISVSYMFYPHQQNPYQS